MKVGDIVLYVGRYIKHKNETCRIEEKLWNDCYRVRFEDGSCINTEYLEELAKDYPPYLDRPKIDRKEHDAVNHPDHYCSDPSGVECIEITKHRDFCVGNAIKYLWRCGLKKDFDKTVKEKEIEDLKKAIWYINAKIDMLTNE